MPRLVLHSADGAFVFEPSSSRDWFVIGRTTDADIRVLVASVGRRHCAIEFRAGVFVLRHLGSTNGTYHNDRLIYDETVQLVSGDRLGLPSADAVERPGIVYRVEVTP